MNYSLKHKKLFIIIVIFVFIASVAITYAWFSTTLTTTGGPNDIITQTGTLGLSYIDGPQISLLTARPGDSVTKTFTVKNTGSLETHYKINWKTFNNAITKDELAVSFECTSYSTYLGVGNAGNVVSGTCDRLTEEAAYNRDLKSNIKIASNITHEYQLTIKFLDINVLQNYNQGKIFSGEIQVVGDNPSWVENCEGNNSLRCTIINDNLVEGNVQNDNSIDFAEASSPANGQGLYRDTKIGDGNNYYFRGGNYCAYTNFLSEDNNGTKCKAAGGTWSTDYDFKCSLDYNQSSCESKGFTYYRLNNNVSFNGFMWKIIRIDEEGNVRLLYNGTSTTARGTSAQVTTVRYKNIFGDNAFTGYMQPIPTTYTVGSGEFTNWSTSNATNIAMGTDYTMNPETGLFTLIGTITTGGYTSSNIGKYTCCSTSSSGCAYVAKIDAVDVTDGTNRLKTATIYSGKFTTTKEQAESNETDSPLKAAVDNWYSDNIANKSTSITSKIATSSGYCNDRRTVTIDGGFGNNSGTFASKNRVTDTHTPSYKCSYESNDLFTINSITKGNNELDYSAGLITADEIAYVGSLYGNVNPRVYVHSGYWYWTLSPAYFGSGLAFSFGFFSYGWFTNYLVYNNFGIRPVISLNSTAIVNMNDAIGGDGSLEHPYVIE